MELLRNRPAVLAAGGLVILAILIGAGAAVLNRAPTPSPVAMPSPSGESASASPSPSASPSASPVASPTPVAVCPMNGNQLSDPALADRVPMLVQIENNPIARPPSGLNLADLVIEAPVEGDTTRFGAVYMCGQTVGAGVGPVRSARYFNVDYWQQLRVVTFHFGGAHLVVSRFNGEGMPYVNGLTGGWPFFYRAGVWGPPHEMFVDVDAAREELENGSLSNLADAVGEVRPPFTFSDNATLPAGRSVQEVILTTASFWQFGWEWDGNAGVWLRTDAGAANFDAITDDRMSARTVMVQVVEQEVLIGENDPGGFPRRYQHLVGNGSGSLYINGRGYDVNWSRASAEDVTSWTYADSGEPVVLPPGRVWWEIIPIGSDVSER